MLTPLRYQRRLHPGDLVLVRLGETTTSAKHAEAKLRTHAGPFEIIRHDGDSAYVLCGADRVEISIHINKLLRYQPSAADLNGINALAPSAQGAALSRWFAFKEATQQGVTELF